MTRRRVIVALTLVVAPFLLWFTSLTLRVYAEEGGPCPPATEETGPTVARLGWSWPELGYVCVRSYADGRTVRYVVRWPT